MLIQTGSAGMTWVAPRSVFEGAILLVPRVLTDPTTQACERLADGFELARLRSPQPDQRRVWFRGLFGMGLRHGRPER